MHQSVDRVYRHLRLEALALRVEEPSPERTPQHAQMHHNMINNRSNNILGPRARESVSFDKGTGGPSLAARFT